MNYSNYALPISRDPSYYGSECSADDAARIARSIGEMAADEFPGLQIAEHNEAGAASRITGPDDTVCETIRQWVEENWTAAL